MEDNIVAGESNFDFFPGIFTNCAYAICVKLMFRCKSEQLWDTVPGQYGLACSTAGIFCHIRLRNMLLTIDRGAFKTVVITIFGLGVLMLASRNMTAFAGGAGMRFSIGGVEFGSRVEQYSTVMTMSQYFHLLDGICVTRIIFAFQGKPAHFSVGFRLSMMQTASTAIQADGTLVSGKRMGHMDVLLKTGRYILGIITETTSIGDGQITIDNVADTVLADYIGQARGVVRYAYHVRLMCTSRRLRRGRWLSGRLGRRRAAGERAAHLAVAIGVY